MKYSNNFSQEKGHGYFRKRNKVLVSMITVFGSLMLSSVAMADEVASTTTSSTNVTTSSQPATSNETTSEQPTTTTSEETTSEQPTTTTSEETPKTSSSEETSSLPQTASATEPTTRSTSVATSTYNTPKIQNDVTFNKATYKSGEDVSISINNPDVTSSDLTVSHLDKVIYELKNAPGNSLVIPNSVFSPNSGYLIDIIGKNADGKQEFHKVAGLSVEDDWTVYPRYGVVAGSKDNHNSITKEQVEGYKNSIDQLANMHINNYFFYDVYNTPANPFPANVERFTQDWATFLIPNSETDPDKRKSYLPVIDTEAVKELVAHVHTTGAKAMLYNMIYAVSLEEGVPNEVKSAVVRNLEDHFNFGKKGDVTATDIQQFLDPGDPNWQKFIIEVMTKAMKEGNFDGWQGDTMGSNWVEKVSEPGKGFSLSEHYPELATAATEALKKEGYDFMINDISTGDADRLGKTNVSAPYAEVWGDSIAYDSTYQALTRLTERMRDLYKGKSPIIAAYTHRGKNASTLSKDNELLTDAIIAASGGYHMTTAALNTSQDAKGFGVIQAEWYLNQNLPVNADFANAEFNYQEFIVAYQELLRGRDTLAHDTRRIVDNTNVLVNGNFIGSNLDNADGVQPGTVYTITKETKTGDRIAHLINLVGITENKWNSSVNTTEKLTNIQAFVPLGKSAKDQAEHASIYWATPDAVEGKYNIKLRETSANVYYDGGAGQWMAAIDVPSLDVWDMLYVKLNEAAHVLYQDENGVELERSSDLVGHTGEKINYSTKETIANYLKKGYELVENGFDADGQPNFDRDATNTNEDGVQEFIVRLAPKIVEFSATQPIQAGQVVPGDSEGRVYPTPLAPAGQTTADLDHLSETVTRTVTYVTEDQDGSNRQPAGIADQTDSLHFTRKGTINLVTGETQLEDWTAQDGTSFAALENPVKKGYVVVAEESTDVASSDLTKAGEHTGIHADAADITDTVIYRPVGAYRISYATGKEPAHAQKEITYLNDPTNPTAIASPTTILPYVEGLEPKDARGQVLNLMDPLDETKGYLLPSPESPTADTAISYAIAKGSVRVRFLTEGGDTDLQEAQDLATEVDFGTKYTSEAPTEITKDGRIYHLVGHRADSADPSGTVTKGMKTVIYDYKLATGTVIARFVIQDTNTELQPELAVATNVDNGTHYVASAPDEISYDGHIYERIGAAEQTGNVEVGTTILIFAYKVKEIPTPQPSPETEKEETVSPLPSVTKANTTDAHEEKGSALLSNKEEEKPLETTSQKEELPEVVPNTPQEGTHLPATGEETSQLALLGLGLLAGLSSLIPYKKKQE